METTLILLLFFCHFLADYTHLSTAKMLDAKKFGRPLTPIFHHALVHMFLMGFAMIPFVGYTAQWSVACLFQLITHFLIDVLKGRVNARFPSVQSPSNKWHWIVFGADQYLHAVVIILMAFYFRANGLFV